MSVPRGTSDAKPLILRKELVQALCLGLKLQTRQILTARNTRVIHGDFARVKLETARRVRHGELRAQILSETHQKRLASLVCAYQPGQVFWVKVGRFGSRAASRDMLRLMSVDVTRLQDISEAQAQDEGMVIFNYLPLMEGKTLPSKFWDTADYWLDTLIRIKRKMTPAQRAKLEQREDMSLLAAGRLSPSARLAFSVLWDLLHGPGAWMRNDWVWSMRVEYWAGNIDRYLEGNS